MFTGCPTQIVASRPRDRTDGSVWASSCCSARWSPWPSGTPWPEACARQPDDDFIPAHVTQHHAQLFVQQVDVKIGVRQPVRQVAHPRQFGLQGRAFGRQFLAFGVDLHPAEQPVIALDRGEGEIAAPGSRPAPETGRRQSPVGIESGSFCRLAACPLMRRGQFAGAECHSHAAL